MAAKEQIVLEYQLVEKGGDKVVSTVTDITEAWEKSGQAATAALSEKQIDNATAHLTKFNSEVEKTAEGFTSAKSELSELTKQLTSGKLSGKDLQQAKDRAAELKKEINNVRGEIGRLASDTRIFDTFVEGGRAVAAAFSVAQGAAAIFGDENKDLQKSILKVQGALALLTGAQELANIVTKQGGIATQAYGLALKVVDGIAKVTGLSIAASMAVATLGVSALIAGVVYLATAFSDASDETSEFNEETEKHKQAIKDLGVEYDVLTGKLTKYQGELSKLTAGRDFEIRQATENELKELKKVEQERNGFLGRVVFSQEKFDEQEAAIREKYRGPGGVFERIEEKFRADQKVIDATAAKEKRDAADAEAEKDRKRNEENEKAIIAEQFKLTQEGVEKKKAQLEKEIAEARAINDKARVDELEAQKAFQEKQEKEAVDFANKELQRLQAEANLKRQLQEEYFNFAATAASSLRSISSSFFQAETQNLQAEKEKQLLIAGEDAKKREAIEKRFAIAQAKIKRQQAIAEKTFALFDIAITTARAIQSAVAADAAVPVVIPPGIPNPAKPASVAGMTAAIAFALAGAGLRTAAIVAQPLPEIPKFAEGVIGLKRGKNKPGVDTVPAYLTEGESVMTVKATTKYQDELKAAQDLQLEDLIYHKYLLPALKQAGAADKEGNLYDDWLLRREVKANRNADRENSKYIVSGILSGMREQNYLTQRYYS